MRDGFHKNSGLIEKLNPRWQDLAEKLGRPNAVSGIVHR